jgi:hypothetical protein
MNPNQIPQMQGQQPMGAPQMPALPTMESLEQKPVQNSQHLPEWNRPVSNGKGDAQKKQLLQKLMDNLLNKPGRSVHELINGIKSVIGAYKNYAKEWDGLNGSVIGASANPGSSMPSTSTGAGGSDNIQKILRSIQEKKGKDGSGGPGMPSSMPQAPVMVAPQTMNASINKPAPLQQMPPLPPVNTPSQDGYNRPAPVNRLGIFGF